MKDKMVVYVVVGCYPQEGVYDETKIEGLHKGQAHAINHVKALEFVRDYSSENDFSDYEVRFEIQKHFLGD